VAEAVHGGGVDPVDTGLDGVPDRGDRLVIVLGTQANAQSPPPTAHAPKPTRLIVMSVVPNGTVARFWWVAELMTSTLRP
jgi:hypothetical protein